jgi:hypothetical protein
MAKQKEKKESDEIIETDVESIKTETKETKDENLSGLSSEQQESYLNQVKTEYDLSYKHIESKRAINLKRLKLFNNQKRDDSKVGDPTLFAIFNTVFATLYTDRLSVSFEPREEGDYDRALNMQAKAEYDYDKMDKEVVDYYWDWDTCFYGRGLVLLNQFDRERLCPVAENIDAISFLRDPRASSVNGGMKGAGAMRFGGREVGMSMQEMQSNPSYFNLDKITKGKSTIDNISEEAKEAHDEAQNRESTTYSEELLDENYEYPILQWFTHIKGKKYVICTANNSSVLIRCTELKEEDGKPAKRWPIIDRALFPMSNDWDGVSIPDLVEDKQRMKAVLLNLGIDSAKADLYPMYAFDSDRITNRKDLNFGFNKFIPVKGGDVTTAIAPITKSTFYQQVNLILNLLDTAAQKATASPETAQGITPTQDRTLGENQLVTAGADSRRSLSAKIFSWSEKAFWEQYTILISKHFKEGISKQTLRIRGVLAPIWKKITRDDIVALDGYDIYIESSYMAEVKRKKDYNEFLSYLNAVAQYPDVNKRYGLKKLGRLLRIPTQELSILIPPLPDEIIAEDENVKIDENKLPQVGPMDNDMIHIEIHNRAESTAAKLAHVEAHKYMMKKKLEIQEQPQEMGAKIDNYNQVKSPTEVGSMTPASKSKAGTTQPGMMLQ